MPDNPVQLIEIKGDKMPVSIHQKTGLFFTNHEIKLEKGDCLYLFTDGYPDQFGGKNNQKLKYHNFKRILTNIHLLNAKEQHNFLNTELKNWMGENDQIDDILVLGLKI